MTGAQREARRIVREGMRDVIEWLTGNELVAFTPEQLMNFWDILDREDRLVLAENILSGLERADDCVLMDHRALVDENADPRRQLDDVRAENARLRASTVNWHGTCGL